MISKWAVDVMGMDTVIKIMLLDSEENDRAYSLIVYFDGKFVKGKECYTPEEHDEFMLELLFDSSYPRRIYRTHVIF